MEKRLEAWCVASELVEPIVEKHGLEKTNSGSSFLVSSAPISPVAQHIDHIFDVANWLLEDGG